MAAQGLRCGLGLTGSNTQLDAALVMLDADVFTFELFDATLHDMNQPFETVDVFCHGVDDLFVSGFHQLFMLR